MNRIIAAIVLGLLPLATLGAGGGVTPMSANNNLEDNTSLQRGAKVFVNFCMGCHSMGYMRYSRMADDIGLERDLVAQHLMFTTEKIGDPMKIAMRVDDASGWFGVAPPDLSVIARARGVDWLYTYLTTFYADPDPARPFGVNNVMFPDVGMPHVLWPLQGVQSYIKAERPANTVSEQVVRIESDESGFALSTSVTTKDGETAHVTDRLEVTVPGSMTPAEYRKTVRDLVNFLDYAGEPVKLLRFQIGFWALLLLAVFAVAARLLYKEYWRDVH
ncbi:MAG: cytochrome c1 [Gammaproteobacteria bacterium]|nr:cytochrome c1 [Gammaproteobacteria bacterium]NIM74889.1 cytochrome c1 [Gammaproteobacteria bacterium]NIN39678.1 cytochrome c1 [Gammaproteobacteria bacterium]NIO26806.1 cytochrome c1 [Gammaproteobacteria bacterium]NIO67362.1 cytochrome c1 [Gammaproteobacteria bacterium]